MSAAAALPRAHRRALLIAAATLWLPTLLPIVLGMLRDSHSALQGYLMLLPVAPGMIVPALLQIKMSAWLIAAAAVPVLLLFAGLWFAARRLPTRSLHIIQTVVIVLVAIESIGLAQAVLA